VVEVDDAPERDEGGRRPFVELRHDVVHGCREQRARRRQLAFLEKALGLLGEDRLGDPRQAIHDERAAR
jgi:hypothetical protein